MGHASPEVIAVLTKALGDKDSGVRRNAAEILVNLGHASPEVIAVLTKALADEDSWMRKNTAEILVNLGHASPEVIAVLTKALGDKDSWVRRHAVEALGNLGHASPEVIAVLTKALGDEDSWVRRNAAEALDNLGHASPEVIEVLIKALGDEDSVVNHAARALGKLGHASPEAIAALIKMLTAAVGNARALAREALDNLDHASPEVMAVLIKALEHNDWGVRDVVLKVLVKLKHNIPEMTAVLINALGDEVSDVRQRAVMALGDLVGHTGLEVITVLIKALKHKNSRVRENAVWILGNLGHASPEIITGLTKALGDEDSGVKKNAAEALGKLGDASSEVITGLTKALGDEDSGVRKNAAEALGKLGDASSEVITGLTKALGDEDSGVRKNAAEALGKLGDANSKVITALIKALKHKNPRARKNAVWILGNLRHASSEVITVLTKALGDEDSGVRKNAAEALGKLGDASPEVIAILISDLGNVDWKVSLHIVLFLGHLGQKSKEIRAALINALENMDWMVREDAAKALGELREADPEVMAALTKALEDVDSGVSFYAAEALGNLGHASLEEEMKTHIKSLECNNQDVRIHAAMELLNLGNISPEVLVALINFLKYEGQGRLIEMHYNDDGKWITIDEDEQALNDKDMGKRKKDELVMVAEALRNLISSPKIIENLIMVLEENPQKISIQEFFEIKLPRHIYLNPNLNISTETRTQFFEHFIKVAREEGSAIFIRDNIMHYFENNQHHQIALPSEQMDLLIRIAKEKFQFPEPQLASDHFDDNYMHQDNFQDDIIYGNGAESELLVPSIFQGKEIVYDKHRGITAAKQTVAYQLSHYATRAVKSLASRLSGFYPSSNDIQPEKAALDIKIAETQKREDDSDSDFMKLPESTEKQTEETAEVPPSESVLNSVGQTVKLACKTFFEVPETTLDEFIESAKFDPPIIKPTSEKQLAQHVAQTQYTTLTEKFIIGQWIVHQCKKYSTYTFPWNQLRYLTQNDKADLEAAKKQLLQYENHFKQQQDSKAGRSGLFEDRFYHVEKTIKLVRRQINSATKWNEISDTKLKEIQSQIESVQRSICYISERNKELHRINIQEKRLQKSNAKTGKNDGLEISQNTTTGELSCKKRVDLLQACSAFFWHSSAEQLGASHEQSLTAPTINAATFETSKQRIPSPMRKGLA